jgi:hypothetical protein
LPSCRSAVNASRVASTISRIMARSAASLVASIPVRYRANATGTTNAACPDSQPPMSALIVVEPGPAEHAVQAPDPSGRRPLRLAQDRVLPADQHVPDDRPVPCTPDGGEAEQSAPAKGRDERTSGSGRGRRKGANTATSPATYFTARPVREAVRANGPVERPAPRLGPTSQRPPSAPQPGAGSLDDGGLRDRAPARADADA